MSYQSEINYWVVHEKALPTLYARYCNQLASETDAKEKQKLQEAIKRLEAAIIQLDMEDEGWYEENGIWKRSFEP